MPPPRGTPLGRIAVFVAVVLAWGCAGRDWVRVRSVPDNPLADRLRLMSRRGAEPSPRTGQLLRRYNLADTAARNPQLALGALQRLLEREPNLETMHAIAELAYVEGRRAEPYHPRRALDFYLTSSAHAYLYLFDERFTHARHAYEPQFRGACDLYNSALEGALRILRQRSELRPGRTYTVQSNAQRIHLHIVSTTSAWPADCFDRFEFVSDYELKGLSNRYHTYGLGVPLIVVPDGQHDHPRLHEYLPPGLSFPVTAFLRLLPCQSPAEEAGLNRHAVLEFHDPLDHSHALVGRRLVPLETDLSTPLAYALENSSLRALDLATLGLLYPADHQMKHREGLYMLEPYRPGKIPVVMIHGLWSSPITWMEMFNDLRGDGTIRPHYQFWFYLYPTGQPFLRSAAQLRSELVHMRRVLDPSGTDSALDQMVLVGHSMGGLVATLQTVESGEDFWRIVSERPFEELIAPGPASSDLAANFFFVPIPSVRRVITIATPFGGSGLANRTTRWLSHKLISLPRVAVMMRPSTLLGGPPPWKMNPSRMPTSVDSLAPDSPVLAALRSARVSTEVEYHNIVGDLPGRGVLGRFLGGGDGVVSLANAANPVVSTHVVVPADHGSVHRHPRAILEVREILKGHWLQWDARRRASGAMPPPARLGPYRASWRGGSPPASVLER